MHQAIKQESQNDGWVCVCVWESMLRVRLNVNTKHSKPNLDLTPRLDTDQTLSPPAVCHLRRRKPPSSYC